MGKIMMNDVQYGIGGITDAEDIKYNNTTVKDKIDLIDDNINAINNAWGHSVNSDFTAKNNIPNNSLFTAKENGITKLYRACDNYRIGETVEMCEEIGDYLHDHIPLMNALFELIYPIGSIYISVNNTNPSSLFGGTWVAWGNGRVPVGVDANVTDFDTVEKTGGVSSVTLTSAQSGVPAHAHGLNGHTHEVGAHAHGLNGHTHSIPALSGTAASAGAHTHTVGIAQSNTEASGKGLQDGSGWFSDRVMISSSNTKTTSQNGAHTHTVSTTASTTGGNSGSTANSTKFNTGGNSGNTADNTAANASQAHTNLQPYITCYMWKRTA